MPTPSSLILNQSHYGFSIAFSLDGRYMAVGNADDEEISLIALNSHAVMWTFQAPDSDLPRPAPHWALAVNFSPDGSRLAMGGTEEKIYLLDSATGQVLDQRNHNDTVGYVAFSADGEYVIATSCHENPGMTVWRLPDGTTERYDISACLSAMSPTQPLVAISGVGQTILFDLHSGQAQPILANDASSSSLAFSPDGKTLTAESNHELQTFDLSSKPKAVATSVPWRDYLSTVDYLAWSANNLLAILRVDDSATFGTLLIWDLTNEKVVSTTKVPFSPSSFDKLIFSSDGTQLAIVSATGIMIWAIP